MLFSEPHLVFVAQSLLHPLLSGIIPDSASSGVQVGLW